jgi:hypothetical protein
MVDKLKIRRDTATGELQVKCFLEDMEVFYQVGVFSFITLTVIAIIF